MLTRDQILKVKDIKIEEVQVPEWGGSVFVKGLTGSERDQFESSVVELQGKTQRINMKNVRAKLAALSICNEEGERLFTDGDILELSKKSANALQKVFDVASRLSGLSADDVESLTKNSKGGVTVDSILD